MRIMIAAFLALSVLTGCQAGSQTKPSSPSNNLAIYGLIFGIEKDKSGAVESVRLASVEDVRTKSAVQFDLTESLMNQAETKIIEQHKGVDEYSASGKEYFVVCIYTNLDPDTVKCGEEE